MIEFLLDKLASYHHRVFGSTTLLPHERMCLDAWQASLSEVGRKTLALQLASLYLVQRQAAGAKVCFYQREQQPVVLFRDVRPNLQVAVVALGTDEAPATHALRAKVFVHQGKFFSIEFPKRPDRYLKLHHMRAERLRAVAVETLVALD
jgi:hypothetical protein